jgi:hypothetical protein
VGSNPDISQKDKKGDISKKEWPKKYRKKGLVAGCYSTLLIYFKSFVLLGPSTSLHDCGLNWKNLQWGAELRFDLGPIIQQVDACFATPLSCAAT